MSTEFDDGAFSLRDILRDAFPNHSDEEVNPIGLLYAGMHWGCDYRYATVPRDLNGKPLYTGDSNEDFESYVSWLAEHLATVWAEPSSEQIGLCKYVDRMEAGIAALMLGMNAAMYQHDVEKVEYSEEFKEDEFKEEIGEQQYLALLKRTECERAEREKYCPDSEFIDLGYRVPLSIVIKKVQEPERRKELLKTFFSVYNEYIYK